MPQTVSCPIENRSKNNTSTYRYFCHQVELVGPVLAIPKNYACAFTFLPKKLIALHSLPSHPRTPRQRLMAIYIQTDRRVRTLYIYSYLTYIDIYYDIQKHTERNIFRYFMALSITGLKFCFLASQGLFYHDYKQPSTVLYTYIGHLISPCYV